MQQKKRLLLPSGLLMLSAPLMFFIPGLPQTHIDVEGQGTALAGGPGFPVGPLSADYRANTILLVNYKDKPGVIFQNSRYSTLKKVSIMGLNSTAFNGPIVPSNNQSDYVGAGFATGQQSPHCGIAIDPFPAVPPPDGGYAGLGAYYGPLPSGSGSTGIKFEEVYVTQFVVGVAHSCAGVSQGDQTSFINCDIHFCDVGYACGNSQARSTIFKGGGIGNCRRLFDTMSYGNPAGIGCNPILIDGVLVLHAYQLIAMNGVNACTLRGVYGESVSSIGYFGLGSGNAVPLLIEGCEFSLRDSLFAGKMPPLILEAGSPVTVKNSKLSSDLDRDVYNLIGGATGITYEQSTFRGTGLTDVPPLISVDFNGTYGGRFQDCQTIQSAAGSQIPISDTSIRHASISNLANGKGRLRTTQQTRWVTDGATQYLNQPRSAVPHISISTAAASIAIVGTTLTLTLATLGELQVNDILMWLTLPIAPSVQGYIVPMWKVASIDGSGNVVANALYDISLYGTVANTAASLGANAVAVVHHQWAPSVPLTGNTHSNTTLDGLSASALINGDFVQGAGIPVKTRVVSGGGTASVVLSKAATATANGVTLFDGRLLIPTTTVAF